MRRVFGWLRRRIVGAAAVAVLVGGMAVPAFAATPQGNYWVNRAVGAGQAAYACFVTGVTLGGFGTSWCMQGGQWMIDNGGITPFRPQGMPIGPDAWWPFEKW